MKAHLVLVAVGVMLCSCPLLAGFRQIPIHSYDFTPEPVAGWAIDPDRTKLTDGIVPAEGENWGANKTVGWEMPANSGPTVIFDLGQAYEVDAISLTHFGSYYGFQEVTISSVTDPNVADYAVAGTFANALLDSTQKGESVQQEIVVTAVGRYFKLDFVNAEPGYANAWTMLSEVEFYQLDPNTILIQQQPQDLILIEGGEGQLSVTAWAKTPPLSYQWKKDGVPIDGATEATLSIVGATGDDEGVYTCVVSSAGNPTGEESAAATVRVFAAPPITGYGSRVISHGPVVYWSFDEDEGPALELTTLLPNRMLTADQPDRFAHGELGNAIAVHEFANVFGTTTLDSVVTQGPFAIEFWLRVPDPTVTNRYIMEIGIPGGMGNLPGVIFGYNPTELELFQGIRTQGFTYEDPNEWSQWHHIVLVDYDDEVEAYDNGVRLDGFDYRAAGGDFRLDLSQEIAVGSVRKTHAASPTSIIDGDLDEVAIYVFDGMDKEAIRARVQAIALHSDLSGPAYITEQPSDTIAPPLTDAVLRVAAAGAEPIRYQWSKDGEPIDGADGPVLVLPEVQPGVDDGTYVCLVENDEGSEASEPAVLTVACYYDIPGDINSDCLVDVEDLAIMAAHWLEDSSVLP